MCQGLSGTITSARKAPYWIEGQNSHSEVDAHYHIHGDNCNTLEACRKLHYEFLIVAKPSDIFDPTQWRFTIDADNSNLPSWYTDQAAEYEDIARADHLIPQLAAWKASGKYPGHLGLSSITTLPEGVTLSAGADLDLRSITTLPEGVTLRAGGYLDLSSLTTLPEGVTLSAGGHLYLSSITTLPEGVTLSAGADLGLRSITTLPEGVTLSAGADLYMRSLDLLPKSAKAKYSRLWLKNGLQ